MGRTLPELRVRASGARRVRAGHPWVFRDELEAAEGVANGDIVRVISRERNHLGFAFYSSHSKIALRLVSREQEPPQEEFWANRVADAWGHRERVVRDTDSYRIIFGESDGIPGLVVDRYGAHLVVQALTAGAEKILDTVLDRLEDHMGVSSVLARNDPSVRSLEGLDRVIVQVRGITPQKMEVHEGDVRVEVEPWGGQKTGAFLDQRENRMAAAKLAKGRVLDAFSYHGSFAIHAAARADEVEAVDSSTEALERGRRNAQRNARSNVRFTEANVFEDLRARTRRGESFDLIFLDPPAFAKSRAELAAARRGYKEINLQAMRLLRPGGILVTSSCSYHLGERDWIGVLSSSSADARRSFRVMERRAQAPDHPVRLGFPESQYLKCLVLSVM